MFVVFFALLLSLWVIWWLQMIFAGTCPSCTKQRAHCAKQRPPIITAFDPLESCKNWFGALTELTRKKG